MNIPKELKYTKSHEWVETLENGNVRVGITDHAQEAMGDLVYVELPEEGDAFGAGDNLAVVESVKAVSDVYSPISGEVVAVNEGLMDDPAAINADAYGAWFVEMTNADDGDFLTAEEYEELVANEE